MNINGIELKHGMKVKVNITDAVRIYDENDNTIYYEDSDGDWSKREYDKNNNEIYFEDANGYWAKSEYDENDNKIYHENSYGYIQDNRLHAITIDGKEIEISAESYRQLKKSLTE